MLVFDSGAAIGLVIALLVALVGYRSVSRGLFYLAVPALLLHLALEGLRWQLVPLYGVFLWLGYRMAVGGERKHATAMVSIVFIGISAGLSWALPVFELPLPAGPHSVGLVTHYFQDDSRFETHTPDPTDYRRLRVQLWYPSSVESDGEGRYWQNDARRNKLLAGALQLPKTLGFLFSHLGRVKTHSSANAAPVSGTHPVVLFSHGLNFGFSGQNTTLMEHLASHGFVVAAIDHAYWSLFIDYPDGSSADSSEIQSQFTMRYQEEVTRENEAISKPITSDMSHELLHDLMQHWINGFPKSAALSQQGLDLWSADQRFVLDKLDQLNQYSELSLDVRNVAVMGMSYGGSTAQQTCSQDARCKVGINIDGFQPVSIRLGKSVKPFLYFRSANNNLIRYSHDKAAARSTLVSVAATEHTNYTDFSLLSPLLRGMPPFLGEIEPRDVMSLTNRCVLGFLRTELLHTNKGSAAEIESCAVGISQARIERK